ncbi:acetate/propionate family kinase [Pseudophaeobacter flagellatus]|uniref:acetate/propionate family kinase n=1 Tax=Pseudophaeobacter flagellatus TaxID=2899119 RepID=UPI001E2F81C4|nr:acetate/propionate family kinase [Pseudophaeobacter flagellatus]MCD9148038.1 acetate/propionate family kinase [Pseudophaeobacter flagellatus]
MSPPADILVLNTGSSSVKFALFDATLQERLSGVAEGIGGRGHIRLANTDRALDLPDHSAALAAVLQDLTEAGTGPASLRAVAHRVVHGGTSLTRPTPITAAVRAGIKACVPLAPLHNPQALAAIDALDHLAPDLAQYASFDTAFHATAPQVAQRYALPPEAEDLGLRRYGFHGLSYAALCRRLPEISGRPLPSRLLAFHLGNGASICAIHAGQSVATTMGYSPLEGLTMGTRVGTLDPNATLRLVEEIGLRETKLLLNSHSGLAGLSGGLSDMRALEQAGTAAADFAIDHFCYWAIRHGHSLIGAMGGCDAIAFTGGIGENARNIRARILDGFAWLGCVIDPECNAQNAACLTRQADTPAAWIVPAEEERQIAMDARTLIEALP